ncbi:unnamed protein product [Moneuplotes crassus]|uniref:Uncharacterized protein n=1 Tax=Euplotes crassus TaxID=5936 RepID=A0AAD2D4N5_EUPCR|nr:unnamed protein product [Moneuplotes crassus]
MFGGKLKFKKGLKKPKVKHHKKKKPKDPLEEQRKVMERFQREVLGVKEEEQLCGKKRKREEEQPEYETQSVKEGEGEILVSHTTVHGFKTAFKEVLEAGDTLIVKNPEVKEGEDEEERVKISMVLSDKSMGIEKPLSFVPKEKVTFKYQKKPVLKEEEKTFEDFLAEKKKERKREIKEDEKKKYTVVEVREKTGMWGYKTKKIKVKGQLSREEILDIRAQAAGDKTGI